VEEERGSVKLRRDKKGPMVREKSCNPRGRENESGGRKE